MYVKVPETLRSTHTETILLAMRAKRAVKRITFITTKANPGDTLFVSVPKLPENEVLVPSSPPLRFEVDLDCGHENNYLVQNVTRALVVKFGGTTLEDTVGYDIYKTFEDLFLPVDKTRQHGALGDPKGRLVHDTPQSRGHENVGRRR